MEMSEKLMELHSKGYNCGQIICAVLGEELGWDQSTPEALADMCESCGQICGTLRGGDLLHQQIHEIPFERESGSIKDAVKSYWSKRSSSFSEDKHDEAHSYKADLWRSELSERLPAGDGLRILDAGCGAGFFEIVLAPSGYRLQRSRGRQGCGR